MLKAIFMDFYGTAAYEISPIAIEVITKIYKSSNANSMEEITEYWWRTFRERLSHFNGENFRTQHDVTPKWRKQNMRLLRWTMSVAIFPFPKWSRRPYGRLLN